MECPNEEWLDIILKNKSFQDYQEKTSSNVTGDTKVPVYMVHFTPSKIINNPKYQRWMEKFGSDVEHLIINEDNEGYSFEDMHRLQHQLRLIHPTIFPFLGNEKNFFNKSSNLTKKAKEELINKKVNEEVLIIRLIFKSFIYIEGNKYT